MFREVDPLRIDFGLWLTWRLLVFGSAPQGPRHRGPHVEAARNGPLPCMIETPGEALKRNGLSFKRDRYALKNGATMPHSKNCYEDTIPALSYFFVNS